MDPVDDPGADFSLSLSSASLRLSAERHAADAPGQAATTAASDAARAPAEASPAVPAPSSPAPAAASAPTPSPAAEPAGNARRGPSSRAIEAYREIARAPVGERIRILA